VLNIRTSDSIFKFVETNDFKQLPHITLSFRPGNDFAVKQFLAFRLQEVKEDYQAVCSELTDTKVRAKQGSSTAGGIAYPHSSQLLTPSSHFDTGLHGQDFYTCRPHCTARPVPVTTTHDHACLSSAASIAASACFLLM
jgi:hypothetical protein